jgi:hypothetical protein
MDDAMYFLGTYGGTSEEDSSNMASQSTKDVDYGTRKPF